MKKSYIIILILGIIGLIAYVSFPYFTKKETTENFKVDQNSDFYVISSRSIASYKLSNGIIKKRSESLVKLPEIVNPWLHKGEFNNRYLVVSAGDNSDFTDDERILSVDLKQGIIEKKVNPHYAYTGSGFSDNYFYSFQATTDDGGLYQFDKLANEMGSYMFTSSTTPGSQFVGENGKLYLIGNQVTKENDSLYESHLFIMDEKSLTILEDILLDDDDSRLYGFSNLAIVNHSLFSPIAEIRDRTTYERTPNHTFLRYDLETKEKEYYSLTENYPNLIYASKTSDYLIFIHEPYSLEKSGLSIFNMKTKKSQFVNVGEILESNDLEKSQIVSVNTDQANRLFILTKIGLIIWDMQENKLIGKDTAIDNTAFYTWANE